jgi:DNA topoisomerase-1
MAKSLVIVESPTKARTLTRILGKDVKVVASMGHVRDLPKKRLGINLKEGFSPQYEISAERKPVVAELTKAVKAAESVYLATDPDREGEAIAWHLEEVLSQQKKGLKFMRVTFHEITKNAVLHAFESPHELNMNLVNAQQARRVLDRLVGYQVSPLLWNRVKRDTSAGRVQSVALRLVCERQAAIDIFEPQEYWNILATFLQPGATEGFDAKLHRIDGAKLEIGNGELAAEIAADATSAEYKVAEVSRTPRKRRPSPPFITSTLQQAASSNLRFSTDQVMRVAQQLYEGVDTGSGPTGLITYMRTDSVNVAKEAQEAAREYITENIGAEYMPEKPNNYKSRKSAQEAHEAIRPTDVQMTPQLAAKYLDERQVKLYTLIWERFLASQMAPAQTLLYAVELGNVEGTAKRAYCFRASVTTVTFQGFLKVYNLEDVVGDDKVEEQQAVPELTGGEGCKMENLESEQKFTEPPPSFSEASLVRALEADGIGRPSTYASIVRTIQQRDYVRKDKSKMCPTELGILVNTYLVDKMPKLFQVDFTADMEDKLDTIEQGKIEWDKMIETFYEDFSVWLTEAKLGAGADTGAVRAILEAFPETTEWHEPEKVGRRTFDDKKFYTSLKRQLDNDKAFSDKQWNALLILLLRYETQLPDCAGLIAKLEINEAVEAVRTEQREREIAREAQRPDEESLRIYRCLDPITEWEEPTTSGKRVYDDKKFYGSLIEQLEAGKQLSPAQLNALKRIVVKYCNQISNYDEVQVQLELPTAADIAKTQTELRTLLGVAGDIKEFAAPSGKGRRRFDESEFVQSLSDQFEQRSQLSDRQVTALKRLLVKHKGQVDNFDSRVAGIELSPPQKKTDVDCPKCGKGKLVERKYRGNTFYGCEHYRNKECDYRISSLDDIAAAAE